MKKQSLKSLVAEHIDVIVYGTNSDTVEQAIVAVDASDEYQADIANKFKASWSEVKAEIEANITSLSAQFNGEV